MTKRKNIEVATVETLPVEIDANPFEGAPMLDPETNLEPSDADIEAEAEKLESYEEQPSETVLEEPASDEVSEDEAENDDQELPTFDELRDAISDEEAEQVMAETEEALKDRERFEDIKNPTNTNIHRTIKNARRDLVRMHAAKVLCAAAVDPDFLNRSIHDGSRYNVYAIGKVADFVDGLAGRGVTNAINIACMRSLFAFDKVGIAFTGDMARAAASDKIRVDAKVREHLVRHTVSASTAPTQASSTMQALQTLGVVSAVGSRKNPVYVLRDTPQRWKLQAIAEAMAA